jgi:GntR family transcriptional regulator
MRSLDPASGLPLYLQVARALQEDIAAGALEEGDAAPSLRGVAAELRINVHTVAKAWQHLEREGVLRRARGGPYRVAAVAEAAEDLLRADVHALLARAASLGLSDRAVLELLVQAVEARRRETA